MKRSLLLLVIGLLAGIGAGAQAGKKMVTPLRVIARPDSTGHTIRLRWAVTNTTLWKLTNQYGFVLERYTVLRDKKMLGVPERKVLGLPIRSKPLNDWEALAKKDQYAAVIAQALYGSDFQVGSVSKGMGHLISQSQEMEQRFSFSLFAADMSFEASLLAGWGYVDNDIRPNEKYLYRLSAAAPVALAKKDSAAVFIGAADYEVLPAVQEIQAQFGNRVVMLSWDYDRVATYYTSYFVERSEDNGKTFHRLSDMPVANLNEGEKHRAKRMYLTDTLHSNELTYQYRVRGINPFGETGPPSDIVKGKGVNVLPFVPGIQSAYADDKGLLQMRWEFEENANTLIKGFRLNKADHADGPYKIYIDSIAVTKRALQLKNPVEGSGYFTLTAIAKEGEGRTSFPVLVQPLDSIPPDIPAGLQAVIDSNGVVSLSWNKNSERDLMGYKVYRAMKQDEEPIPLVDSVWQGNQFRDKLSLKLLNKKVYYGVAALDKRWNQSAMSALVEVKKPDIIPPSAAVINRFTVDANKVTLSWINSMDEDIAAHALYRKGAGDSGYVLVKNFLAKSATGYTDTVQTGAGQYHYYLAARSEAGLVTASEPLVVTITSAAAGPLQLTRLYAYPQPENKRVEIVWEDALKQVSNYQVYRAIGTGGMSLWKIIPAAQKGLYDTDVQPNTVYHYAVQAVLLSGAYSEMKKVTVNY
ncbi:MULTISPECIES: fibronectin type III domain-containing protein [Niastella]|uniref:Fibronectin type-III domain-containing protein n=1 Tax=Niastella soli TaxID=2821487 RepID=A0ABS3YW53_9BACT|nr:hypothetical protein [Niastella soli]MBO9202161.1 hypothetical protein [Niastella soli]